MPNPPSTSPSPEPSPGHVPTQPSPHRVSGGKRVLAGLIAQWIKVLGRSLRWKLEDRSGLMLDTQRRQPILLALWHDELGLALALQQHLIRHRLYPHRLTILVSASRDGAFISHALEQLGIFSIRGSSSRRGSQALRELITTAKAGSDLAITPDGPRGPRHQLQDGVLAAAQLTGLPIVAVRFRIQRVWRLRSWDRFQVPFPCSLCEATFEAPLHVPRACSNELRASLRQTLQQRMTTDPDPGSGFSRPTDPSTP